MVSAQVDVQMEAEGWSPGDIKGVLGDGGLDGPDKAAAMLQERNRKLSADAAVHKRAAADAQHAARAAAEDAAAARNESEALKVGPCERAWMCERQGW